jgi:hypothetical protein
MPLIFGEEAEPSTPAASKATVFVTVGSPGELKVKHEDGSVVALEAGAGGGQTNTASNQGTGTNIFIQKTASDLEFNGIKSENSRITIAEDVTSNDVEITLVESAIDHDALTNYLAAEHVDWAGAGTGTVHTDNYIEGGDGTDTTAIHADTASEISGITVKGTPVGADFLIIEDSADTNAKKHVLISGLEAILDHDALTNFVANEHLDWTASVGTIHTDNYIEGGDGTDGTAIHSDVSSEISALTDKDSPVGADMLIIEDSAAGNAKKRVSITNLPAGGEINDLETDGASGIATGELAIGTGAGAVTYQKISILTEEESPTTGDWLLCEEAGGLVRKVDVGNLPAGSEVNALVADGISGVADDQLAVGTGAGTAAYQTLPNGAVSYDTTGGTFSQAAAADLSDGIPNTRTITVAGDANEITVAEGAQDLSANRTFTVGIVDNPTIPGDYITIPSKADPDPTGANGRLFYNTTDSILRYGESTTWRDLIYAGGAFHDGFSDHVANEHLDWTASVGTIHTDNYIEGGDGTDGTAIHNNVASEISGIANKGTPVAGDFLVIEDSAAANVKKHTLVSEFEAILDHANILNIGSNAHSVIDTHLGAANPHSGSAASGANSDITAISGLSTPLAETQGGTGTATWTAGDLPYSDATNSLAGLAKGGAFEHLRMDADGDFPEWAIDTKSKSITIEDPADGDRLALWMNESALTVLGVSFASLAGTSVLFNLEYAATIASGTVIHADTCASSTPEWDVTPSGTADVPTNQIILVEITTVTASVTDFVVTVHYRENV